MNDNTPDTGLTLHGQLSCHDSLLGMICFGGTGGKPKDCPSHPNGFVTLDKCCPLLSLGSQIYSSPAYLTRMWKRDESLPDTDREACDCLCKSLPPGALS